MAITELVARRPAHRAVAAPRPRRRDIQGLRAIAVLLVVLFHAGAPWLPGGYVGVDVFFAVSGFVITTSLVDHRESSGTVSLRRFYGRRAQRILPMAATTLIVTVVGAYALLGYVEGARAAHDASWAAVFLANVHQAASGATYLGSQLQPSLLQHFWSLAVEEQFYLAWPVIVLVSTLLWRGEHWRRRLVGVTLALVVISFVWSVVSTAHGGSWPYYSPFTRAWELGVGALCALVANRLRGLSTSMRAYTAVVGLIAIGLSATLFSSTTPFPGIAAALPVLGAACVLVAGVGGGYGPLAALLGSAPFVVVGNLSYSLYLWHWPVLTIAERVAGHELGDTARTLLVLGAVVLSGLSYVFVEGPLHRAVLLRRRPALSMATGAGLVTAVLVTAVVGVQTHPRVTTVPTAADANGVSNVTDSELRASVSAAAGIEQVPDELTPSVGAPGDRGASSCAPQVVATLPVCVSGDTSSDRVMAVYGDSHADEWTFALSPIAEQAHLKLVDFALPSCPAVDLQLYSFVTDAPNTACDSWHADAPRAIASLHPAYVVLASSGHDQVHPDQTPVSDAQWESGLRSTIEQVRSPGARVVILGDYAYLPQPAPECVAAHSRDVQRCSTTLSAQTGLSHDDAERAAAASEGVEYIDTIPWVCSTRCTAVIGPYLVYKDGYHLTAAYTEHLSGPLASALGL